MATLGSGIVTTDEAFGHKGVMLENSIKQVGWTATPFYSLIAEAAPADRSANVALGHRWFYDVAPEAEDDNAHVEGGEMAEVKKYSGGELVNHFQIVKSAYGVSGSEMESRRVDNKAVLAKQGEMASLAHKKTIEKILLSDTAPVARNNASTPKVAGKCGGLKSFATADNTIDASRAALSWDYILELLKIGYLNGGEYGVIMLADKQNDALNKLLLDKVQATMDTNVFGVNVTAIKATSYGTNIKIVLNPFLAQDEIIALRPQDIFKVNWRPMHVKDRETTNDEVKQEIISEFTLRVAQPYAFAWLKGLQA